MSSVPPTSAANLNVGRDPSPISAPISSDSKLNPFIERTKEVKVDVNDYSRFKDIGKDLEDEDEDMKQPKTTSTVMASESKCRNCSKRGAKLKCSICRKTVYCERKCQASDWQFHKRICKKPEPPKKPDPVRQSPTSSSTTSSSSKSTSSSSSSSKSKTSSGSSIVVTDEPDLPENIRGYKNGLPYFHREMSKEEKTLIGDIAPQKIAAEVDHVQHDGSAWNKAGTFEERVVTKWAEDKWKELFTGATYSENNLQATFKAPDRITGDASICVVRGKKRYLFDFSFKLPFKVVISGGSICKGAFDVKDASNDEDYEVSCKLTEKPSSSSEQTAVQAFIANKSCGLQKELVRLIRVFATEFQQL